MADLLHAVEKLAVFAFIVSSMLASGLTMRPQTLAAPLRNLRFVMLALVLNFAVAPAFAWLLTAMLPLERGYATGLLLLGGAGGAPFLPKLVQFARGDAAFAAAQMVLLTIGTIVFMPFALLLIIPGMQGDAWSIARPLVLLIVLPLIAGMLLNQFANALATRAAPVFAQIGSATLLLFFVLLLALGARSLLSLIGSWAIAAAALYFAGLFILGLQFGRIEPQRRDVLALGAAARNFGAALVPAQSSFRDPTVNLMIVTAAIMCLIVSFAAAWWLRGGADPCN